MTLYLIGLGLENEKDISVKGLEIIKRCDVVYLENYTSLLQVSINKLEDFYEKKIILADRDKTEMGDEKIIEEASNKDVAFLVIGDPFSATTHVDLLKLAKDKNVDVRVINNASILTAVGVTGLQLYKFGQTTSIPFLDDFPELETPYHVIKENKERGLHTLCLLDIKVDQDRFMTVKQAIEVLEDIEQRVSKSLVTSDLLIIGCARLGTDSAIIKSGKLSEIKDINFGKVPHCLIIPGKMHFLEEEMLKLYS